MSRLCLKKRPARHGLIKKQLVEQQKQNRHMHSAYGQNMGYACRRKSLPLLCLHQVFATQHQCRNQSQGLLFHSCLSKTADEAIAESIRFCPRARVSTLQHPGPGRHKSSRTKAFIQQISLIIKFHRPAAPTVWLQGGLCQNTVAGLQRRSQTVFGQVKHTTFIFPAGRLGANYPGRALQTVGLNLRIGQNFEFSPQVIIFELRTGPFLLSAPKKSRT